MGSQITRRAIVCSSLALLACGGDSPLNPSGTRSLSMVSGDGQPGEAGYALEQPFVVRVTDARGRGLRGVRVNWQVVSGEGVLDGQWTRCGPPGTPGWERLANPIPATSVTTDSAGFARTSFTPTWFGPVSVQAHAEGFPGSPVTFTTDASDPGARLEIVSGNDQEVVAGPWTTASEPLVVRLTNGDGAPVPYVLLRWGVASGDAVLIEGGSCPDGHYTSPTTLGTRSHGTYTSFTRQLEFRPRVFGTTTVTAEVPGVQGSPLVFSMKATVVEVHFGRDQVQNRFLFHGPDGSSDVVVPVGAPVEFVTAPGARVMSTTVPSGGQAFDSGRLDQLGRFRFVPGKAGTWEFIEQGSGATGTLSARPADDDLPAAPGLVLSNVITGGAFDVDGFQLTVTSAGSVPRILVMELNTEIRVTDLDPGTTNVELEGVAANCVVSGGTHRLVEESASIDTRLEFQVDCTPPAELSARQLVFARYTAPPTSDASNASLWTLNADGSGLRQLTAGPADWQPSVSPDRTRIAFTRESRDHVDWGPSDIFLVSIDGSGAEQVTDGPHSGYNAVWSPDGSRLAYVAYDGAGWGMRQLGLAVTDADGTNQQLLFPDSGIVLVSPGALAWSPDGSTIAFLRRAPDRTREIWIVGADGSNASRVTSLVAGNWEWYPMLAWSTDGTRILFKEAGRLWSVQRDGMNAKPGLGLASSGIEFTAWSQDRSTIVGVKYMHRIYDAMWDTVGDIYLMRVADGSLVRVTADGMNMHPVIR